jgi:glycosyltransferase involved in cell wall biosynthesis
MTTLLLITNSFPYYPGEQFIEAEIPFLAEAFEDIYLMPLGGDPNYPHRPLPSNVVLIDGIKSFREQRKNSLISRLIGLFRSLGVILGEIKIRKSVFIKYPTALYPLFKMGSSAGQIYPLISNAISEKSPNIIYSYWLSIGALSALLALRKVKMNIPILSRVHGFDLYEERQTPPYCPFQALLISKLEAIVPISQNGEFYLKKKYPHVLSAKIKTSRLGVSSNKLSKMSGNHVLHIVSCSSLVPVKRLDLIVEALSYLDFSIFWTHIGDGPLRNDLEAAANKLTAKKPNIAISFLGQLTNQEVLSFYETHTVDTFINVSSSEGIPVSIMEAMSRGIPAIATSVGGTPEIVDEVHGSGFLLPAKVEPAEIAIMLKHFYDLSVYEKEKMRKAAYSKWLNDFNAEINYNNFALYLGRFSKSSLAI